MKSGHGVYDPLRQTIDEIGVQELEELHGMVAEEMKKKLGKLKAKRGLK